MMELVGRSLGEALRRELGLVRDTRTSHPTKYERIKGLFVNRLGIQVAVCYISDLSRQWTPRVGQAIMGLPQGLIILASESPAKSGRERGEYSERLTRLIEYIGRLEFVVVFVGEERRWDAELVIGPQDSEIRAALGVAFPEARQIAVQVPARKLFSLAQLRDKKSYSE